MGWSEGFGERGRDEISCRGETESSYEKHELPVPTLSTSDGYAESETDDYDDDDDGNGDGESYETARANKYPATRDNGLREVASSVISLNEKPEFAGAVDANNPDYRSAS